MRRVAKARKVRVMGRDNKNLTSRSDEAVELLHGLDNVREVLDHVNCLQSVKGAVKKWVRKPVEFDQNIRPRGWVSVDADRSWQLIDSAADVKNPQATIVQRTLKFKVDINTLRFLYCLGLMC